MTQQTPEPLFGSRFLDIQDEAVPVDYSPRLLRAMDASPEPAPAPRFALPGQAEEPPTPSQPIAGARLIMENDRPVDGLPTAARFIVDPERLVATQPARAMSEPLAEIRLGAEQQRLVAARPARAATEPWAATRLVSEPQRLVAPQPVAVTATAVALAAEPMHAPVADPIVLVVEPLEVAPARAIVEPAEDAEPEVVDDVVVVEPALVIELVVAEPVLAPEPVEFPEPVLAPAPVTIPEPVAELPVVDEAPVMPEPEPVASQPWLSAPAPQPSFSSRATGAFPDPAEYASRWAAASPSSPAAPNVPAPAHNRRFFRRGIDRSRLTL
jgi:hypothetical protein